MQNRRRMIVPVVVIITILVVAGFFIVRDFVLPSFSSPSVTGVPTVVDDRIDALKTNQALTHIAQTATPAVATTLPTSGS